MFLKETIPGSISIPDTDLDSLKGRFPTNQGEKIIAYCGDIIVLSHISCNKLIS